MLQLCAYLGYFAGTTVNRMDPIFCCVVQGTKVSAATVAVANVFDDEKAVE